MNAIIAYLKTLLGLDPSTDKAIAGITKAVSQLDAVIAAEKAKIERLNAVVHNANVDIMDADLRRERAAAIADRLAMLVA